MIDGTFAEKAGAALHWLANQRELRGHGPGAFGIAGAEYADHRNSDGARDVHGSGIIADKQAAGGKQRGKFTDFRRADQVAGAMAHRADDARRHLILLRRAEKYHVGVERRNQPVGERGVAFRFPAFCGTVSRAGSESNPDSILARSRSKQALQCFLPILVRHADADLIDVGQAFQPSGPAEQFEMIVYLVSRRLALSPEPEWLASATSFAHLARSRCVRVFRRARRSTPRRRRSEKAPPRQTFPREARGPAVPCPRILCVRFCCHKR